MRPSCVVDEQQAQHEHAGYLGEDSSTVREHHPPLLTTAGKHPDSVSSFRPSSTGKALTNWNKISKAPRVLRAGALALGRKLIGVWG